MYFTKKKSEMMSETTKTSDKSPYPIMQRLAIMAIDTNTGKSNR